MQIQFQQMLSSFLSLQVLKLDFSNHHAPSDLSHVYNRARWKPRSEIVTALEKEEGKKKEEML